MDDASNLALRVGANGENEPAIADRVVGIREMRFDVGMLKAALLFSVFVEALPLVAFIFFGQAAHFPKKAAASLGGFPRRGLYILRASSTISQEGGGCLGSWEVKEPLYWGT